MAQNKEQYIRNHCNKYANRLKRYVGEKMNMECRVDVYYFPLYDSWAIVSDLDDHALSDTNGLRLQWEKRYLGQFMNKENIYFCMVDSLPNMVNELHTEWMLHSSQKEESIQF